MHLLQKERKKNLRIFWGAGFFPVVIRQGNGHYIGESTVCIEVKRNKIIDNCEKFFRLIYHKDPPSVPSV